jgi:hypothetical protein
VEDSTNSKQTALLLLPDGASSWDLHRSQTFRDFALKHARNWYAFVNDTLQRMVGTSDLYLVTGVTKCASWRITTVDNCWNSLKSEAGQFELENTSCASISGGQLWENQTVFIRGFKVALCSSDPLFSGLGCDISEDGELFLETVSDEIV